MCLPGHSLYYLLSPSRISKLRQRGYSVLLNDLTTNLHKKLFIVRSLYKLVWL